MSYSAHWRRLLTFIPSLSSWQQPCYDVCQDQFRVIVTNLFLVKSELLLPLSASVCEQVLEHPLWK